MLIRAFSTFQTIFRSANVKIHIPIYLHIHTLSVMAEAHFLYRDTFVFDLLILPHHIGYL